MEEIFKKIGTSKTGITFLVSNKGRLKKVYSSGKECFVKQSPFNGYLYAVVFLDEKDHFCTVGVHRLVAKAFLSNPENLKTVNHKDENKHNNNVENLEWMSIRENIRSYFKNHFNDRKTKPYVPKNPGRNKDLMKWASHAVIEENSERIRCWESKSAASRCETSLLASDRNFRKLTDIELDAWESCNTVEEATLVITEMLNRKDFFGLN